MAELVSLPTAATPALHRKEARMKLRAAVVGLGKQAFVRTADAPAQTAASFVVEDRDPTLHPA